MKLTAPYTATPNISKIPPTIDVYRTANRARKDIRYLPNTLDDYTTCVFISTIICARSKLVLLAQDITHPAYGMDQSWFTFEF